MYLSEQKINLFLYTIITGRTILKNVKGFRLLPKHWIVERTFGWLSKQRWLSKDYEALCETSEAMVYAAMLRLMVARLDF